MEKLDFTEVSLFIIRVIMAIMRAPVEELLCQVATGWIPILKYLLSGAWGILWPCPIMLGIKCHHFPRTWLQWRLPGTEWPRACAEPREPGG
jgi:hypothetical protein